MSTKRQYVATSRIIEDVKVTKEGITLIFPHEELLISLSSYSDGYYYPGKELSKSEYLELKRLSKDRQVENYLSMLLKRSRYTIFGIKGKIKHRYPSLTEEEIHVLLLPYIESGILDDLSYAEDFASLKSEAGYGEDYIIAELKKRGIEEKVLKRKEVWSNYSKSKEVLPKLIEKKNRALKNYTLEKRKQNLQAFLIRRGYSATLARKEINAFYQKYSEAEKQSDAKIRVNVLKKEAQKCYNAVTRKPVDAYKKKELFYNKLRMKGFRFDEIQSLVESEGYQFHD
jgi:SOS response regulatory protein OraA/RecX